MQHRHVDSKVKNALAPRQGRPEIDIRTKSPVVLHTATHPLSCIQRKGLRASKYAAAGSALPFPKCQRVNLQETKVAVHAQLEVVS